MELLKKKLFSTITESDPLVIQFAELLKKYEMRISLLGQSQNEIQEVIKIKFDLQNLRLELDEEAQETKQA